MNSLAQAQECVRHLHLSDKLALLEWLKHDIAHECFECGCDGLSTTKPMNVNLFVDDLRWL